MAARSARKFIARVRASIIDGGTLREKIHRERTELKKLLRYLQHAAEGVAKAHAAGIVHRDLKPENIMITRDGHAKVLDFGLAKLIEQASQPNEDSQAFSQVPTAVMQQHSTPGAIMGTVGYMSPEQAQGKLDEIDGRSDIFSFGCILFEAATRTRPFEGDSVVKTLHRLIYEPAPQIKDLNPSAPADLQRIVRRCLAKDKEDRYQTIKDVAIELKELRRELETVGGAGVTPPLFTDTAPIAVTQVPGQSLTAQASLNPSTAVSGEIMAGKLRRRGAVALVVLLSLATAAGLWFFKFRSAASAAANSINSIAVLPFQNRSNDSEAEYLSDGLAESLIFRLSQLPNLKVSPTSSVMRYKGNDVDVARIAAELGVDAVMTGRLVKRGDNLNITVELVDVKNNRSLWGEQYERKMADLLTTQREIAASITQKLQLKLAPNESTGISKRYTDNNEAYQLYLKGRFYFARRTREDLFRSIDLYQQAIALDPNFAVAYSGVGEAYAVMPSFAYAAPHETLPKAKEAVATALRLDPDLAEAHAAYGVILATYDWNRAEARREFQRSIGLNSNIAINHFRYGWVYLSPLGKHDEAIAEMKKAMDLEPLSLIQGSNFTGVYIYARQYDNALEQAKKNYDLDRSFLGGKNWLAHAYNMNGMYAESLEIAEKTLGSSFEMLPQIGYAYAKLGRRREAEAVINRWLAKPQYVSNYWIATVYTALGEKEKAFEQLEKAYRAHDWFMQRVKTDPFLDPLRDDPRMADLLKRVGLTP
ncbi:MAG: hypothetical protein DMF69_17530 [Acidobacteria bacterium]|nr:MAG: hypothetical protein DMF69_17530 [Acidobacteriota bacterium]